MANIPTKYRQNGCHRYSHPEHDERSIFNAAKEATANYRTAVNEAITLSTAGKESEAQELRKTDWVKAANAVRDQIDALVKLNREQAEKASQSAAQATKFAVSAGIAALLAGVVVALILSSLIASKIASRLRRGDCRQRRGTDCFHPSRGRQYQQRRQSGTGLGRTSGAWLPSD